ncbi:MAG: IPT/TIG domain-containing protein [Candidatus Sulfotelmatobacter sp.]
MHAQDSAQLFFRQLLGSRALRALPLFLGIVLGLLRPATAQTVPTISGISPASITAGGPTFTLTVSGSGYLSANSVVQVNGSNRPTIFKSAIQLTATIFATDIATPATLQVTVFNPLGTAPNGGFTSNAVALAVGAAAVPVLISASPEFATQGGERLRMTLVGANFRPGATVVISPPLASVGISNGHTPAGDVYVLSSTVVNSGLMTAIVSLSPAATLGLRAVDVLNLDGTSTGTSVNGGPGTSQPVRVQASSSLGAPLSVLNLALTHPRDGTVVMQGQELNAEAMVAGTGTGTVLGEWVWDGNVVEQFSAAIVGGQSTRIATRQSLPTWFLGAHTLQLRMTQPNQVAARPIVVVVNPGDWRLEQLIQPDYGAAFAGDAAPRLLWAPVPGAAKYQVGFSTQPYVSSIRNWFDVVDNSWNVPAQVWKSLAEGELYWTVRTIETSGTARRPLPMRSIYRAPEGGLTAVHPVPERTAAGHTLLEWKAAIKNGFYYVVVSSDAEGIHPVRQYLTADPKLDLRAVDGQLTPGTTYFWRVDAIAPNGKLIMSGPAQSFVAQSAPKANLNEDRRLVQLASLGAPEALPRPPDLASQITDRTPAPSSSISDPKPAISASFQSPVNPADVSLMVDDVDITSMAQVSEAKVAFTPPLALAGGDHSVNLAVGNEATTWKFTEAAPAAAAPAPTTPAEAVAPGTDAEAPPAVLGALPTPATIAAAHPSPTPVIAKPTTPSAPHKVGPSEEGQVSSSSQWSSGSSPPDSNTFSISERMMYEDGPWKVEINGSGALNSILNPDVQRTSHGIVNDYVFQLGYKGDGWGANLRFGIVSPVLYTDAQFVTAATPRQGAEVTLTTAAGKFGYFVNTNDEALGGGAGINFHQKMMGASWQAPLPKWGMFRLMWLSAQDVGAPTTVSFDSQGNPIILPNPVAPKSQGDVYGAMLNIHLTPKWLWSSEYAFSRDNPDAADPASKSEFGRAWRTGISGQAGKTNVNVTYRDVSENFGNPANPSLTQSSQPNLRGVDSAVSQTTGAGTFGLNYTFLENNVHPTTSAELQMNTFDETWSKQFGSKTNLVLDARQSLTQTGTIPASLQGQPPEQTGAQDQRDISGNLNLSRQIGTVTMSAGGTRDWNRNNYFPTADTITSSLNLGTNLVTRGFFQLNSQINANWVAADGLTVGTMRNITVYVQPAFVWKKPSLQVSPLITLTKGRTILATGALTSDSLTGQYGGRVSWTLPGALKFSTFSAQGSYNQNRDNIMNLDQCSTQLLVLWTATWGYKRTF